MRSYGVLFSAILLAGTHIQDCAQLWRFLVCTLRKNGKRVNALRMFGTDLSASLRTFAVAFIPVMLGIILHEVAHGWVASKRGDQTARMLGRLTLNPVPHIDPMGLFMFVLTSMTGKFIFGWAKPVPVNARNMKSPRTDMMMVSAAGSITNMLLAIVFVFLLKFLLIVPSPEFLYSNTGIFFQEMFWTGVYVNFGLAWINLLPIPPLDGSHILEGLLPPRIGWQYAQLGRYGFLILIVLLLTGIVGAVLSPLMRASIAFVSVLSGLPLPNPF